MIFFSSSLLLLVFLVEFHCAILVPPFGGDSGEVHVEGDFVLRGQSILDLMDLVQQMNDTIAELQSGGGSSTCDDCMPPGSIIAFHGISIPDGWALCNGLDGTPDLRDRFIVGAGVSFPKDQSGGQTTDTVSISGTSGSTSLSTSQIPSHRHSFSTKDYTFNGGQGECSNYPLSMSWPDRCYGGSRTQYTGYYGSGSGHSHSVSLGTSVDTVPPYYSLLYIMKLP